MMNLKDFQKEALDSVAHRNRCAFYHEMGLGKTFTGGEKLISFGTNINLVVCQKSKVNDWIEHFCTHYTLPVYDLTKKQGLADFVSSSARRIGVINYDLLARRKELSKMKAVSAVFDESSMLKNSTAQRTKAAMGLAMLNVVLLSGTPVGGKYEELWTQARLLGWKISKKDFWDRYIITSNYYPVGCSFPIKTVIGYKNVDELKAKLRQYGACFLRSDEVLSLPEQVFSYIKCQPPKEYITFTSSRVVQTEDKLIEGSTPLSLLTGARQLCASYNKNKLQAFADWLESTYDRVVVFYCFTRDMEEMRAIVGKSRPVSLVNGQVHDLEAYERSENSVTFVQIQAGAKGLNLQKANKMAVFSPTLSAEDYMQSLKRIHRIGQKKTCFYYFFVTENSVEEKIYRTLARREDYTLRLFQEQETELGRREEL